MRYKRIPITLADGSVTRTAGRGDVGEFKDVNYTPDFKHNLLSVNQLTLQGYTVTRQRITTRHYQVWSWVQ